MKVIRIAEGGRLEQVEAPEPEPGPEEVVVAVRAAGVNRADLLQRLGRYPAPPDAPADIPGLEYAGRVERRGSRASRLEIGAPVMGIVGGGAYAEKLVVHERAAIRVPPALSLDEAAAVPEAFLTAFDALLLQGRLAPGETLLVHAVGSGVGTAALQVGALVGAYTVGTARAAAKLARAEALGLGRGVVVSAGKFADEVRAASGGGGADVILDLVGGPYLEENVKAAAPGARILAVGLLAGAQGSLPLGLVLSKRLKLIGTVLRSRPIEEKLALARAFERELVPHLASRRLRPVIDRALPMAEAARAHELLESNASFGKLVLTW